MSQHSTPQGWSDESAEKITEFSRAPLSRVHSQFKPANIQTAGEKGKSQSASKEYQALGPKSL